MAIHHSSYFLDIKTRELYSDFDVNYDNDFVLFFNSNCTHYLQSVLSRLSKYSKHHIVHSPNCLINKMKWSSTWPLFFMNHFKVIGHWECYNALSSLICKVFSDEMLGVLVPLDDIGRSPVDWIRCWYQICRAAIWFHLYHLGLIWYSGQWEQASYDNWVSSWSTGVI